LIDETVFVTSVPLAAQMRADLKERRASGKILK
jgi:hypothetical protein